MDNKQSMTQIDKSIISIITELTDNTIIDIKATKKQLDRLYFNKYNKKQFYQINIKRFDENILLYGIIFKQGVSKPIRFHKNVFKYLDDNKSKLLDWLSKYQNYKIEENNNSNISTFDIFELTSNEYNNSLIIKMNVTKIDTFEHEEIQPYFIRINNFIKLLHNIGLVMKLIKES